MAISERDLKVLWGLAAGRCSICKIQVIADKHSVTDTYPFGEVAHIVAEKPGGPRGDKGFPESLRNNYLNLMLLCPNCHTQIDKAPEDFTILKLLQIKQHHESEMGQLYLPDKDSYDKSLQFSRLTAGNWLSPDRKNYVPFEVTKEQWIALFLEPNLGNSVPRKVVRAFEVARGCMIYSWFFYPLASLGFEQVIRVGKLAVRERCQQIHQESEDFAAELKALVAAKVISPLDESRWEALEGLVNSRTFLAGATLFDPGQAVDMLRTMTDLINSLF